MSDDTSITYGDTNWYGTQMKPDQLEPATAEWAGRNAENQCWAFARQQQVVFADALHDRNFNLFVVDSGGEVVQDVFIRRFWMNEVFGTVLVNFNLGGFVNIDYVKIAATLYLDGPNTIIGTTDLTQYDTEGWKSLTMYLSPDWFKPTAVTDSGRLQLRSKGKADGDNGEFGINYAQCLARPRT